MVSAFGQPSAAPQIKAGLNRSLRRVFTGAESSRSVKLSIIIILDAYEPLSLLDSQIQEAPRYRRVGGIGERAETSAPSPAIVARQKAYRIRVFASRRSVAPVACILHSRLQKLGASTKLYGVWVFGVGAGCMGVRDALRVARSLVSAVDDSQDAKDQRLYHHRDGKKNERAIQKN